VGMVAALAPATLGGIAGADGLSARVSHSASHAGRLAQPSPRARPQMAYFPPSREVILFGGLAANSGTTLSDTWALSGTRWHRLHPLTSPPARTAAAIAYDPLLHELVMYGGDCLCGGSGFTLLQDTWAFNGRSWFELKSANLPDYEPNPVLSWDTSTNQLELLAPPPGFGPSPPTGDFNSNSTVALGRWAWAISGWQWLGNATGPPLTIQAPGFVTVPGSEQMLYLAYNPFTGSCPPDPGNCGSDPNGLLYSETWSWNGKVFSKDHPENAPTSSQIVVTDPRLKRVVAVVARTAWLWNGSTWIEQRGGSSRFISFDGVYDPALGDVVVFGTSKYGSYLSATWIWNGASWRQLAV
jgi:hypothetical protein